MTRWIAPALVTLALASPVSAEPVASHVAGDLRLMTMSSRVFGNSRTLRVLLPKDYDAPSNRTRRYGVLYLNDGQNLFDAATSTFNRDEWRVDETVERLTAAGSLPPLIVVGIDHAGRRARAHEYLPYPDAFLEPPDPHPAGDRYPAFLVDEVLPFIDAHFRTIPDAAHRGIGGSSYGALASVFAVVARPGVFGRLLLESPSLYVADARIIEDVKRARALPERVSLGVGTNELGAATCDPGADAGEAGRDVKRLAAVLVAHGLSEHAVHVTVEPCARHEESAWATRLPEALRFLYSR